MKKYFFIAALAFQTMASAQSGDLRARIEFENAEKAFSDGNYKEALDRLNKTEKLLGAWNQKIGYLKIIALDNITDYTEWSSNLDELGSQLNAYVKFTDANPDAVDMEKFREIIAIEDRLSGARKIKEWSEAPDYLAGQTAYDRKDYAEALRLFQMAADNNNLKAMDAVSDMYRDAVGVAVDYDKSLALDTKAAEGGYIISYGDIGAMHLYEMGVPKNYKEAMKWFVKGAEAGDASSMGYIGILYHYGLGVAQNTTEAMTWYNRSLQKQDDMSIMYYMGALFYEGNGVNRDYGKALEWWNKSAALGYVSAMTTMGRMYEEGVGVTVNPAEAVKWYTKAANSGDDIAMVNLGAMHYSGEIPVNYTEAAKWLALAAAADNHYGMAYLGSLYFQGRVVPSAGDASKWLEWFKTAYADQKVTNSDLKYAIAKMYREGVGTSQDKKLAREWENKF